MRALAASDMADALSESCSVLKDTSFQRKNAICRTLYLLSVHLCVYLCGCLRCDANIRCLIRCLMLVVADCGGGQ